VSVYSDKRQDLGIYSRENSGFTASIECSR